MRNAMIATSFAAALGVVSAAPVGATTRTPATYVFDNPILNNLPLDICMVPMLVGCGAPAASYWRRTHGFTRATEWKMGAPGPTRWPLSGAVCTAPFCQGFSRITCER